MESLKREHERRLGRFRRLGLKCNPFRVIDVSDWPPLWLPRSGIDPATMLAACQPAVQIIGPRGWGKSMTLRAIEHEAGRQRMTAAYVYCPAERRARLTLPSSSEALLLLDEADRLGPVGWWRIRRWLNRPGRKLLAGTHEDIEPRLCLPVATFRLPPCDVTTLYAFIAKRIAWADGDPRRFTFRPAAIKRLAELARGSLRHVELICYELFQDIQPNETGKIVIDVEQIEQANRRRKPG